jgi:hypothetical protein
VTARTFVHDGVAYVRVAQFGSGTIVVERGPHGAAVAGTLTCSDPQQLDDVSVVTDGNALRIRFPAHQRADVHLQLSVPDGLDYAIDAGSADISLRADAGQVRLTCGSGDLSLGRVSGLVCKNGSGDIRITSVDGQAARVETGSGDIWIELVRAPLRAKSGSGDLSISQVLAGEVQASSGSGDIEVAATTGSVDLRTASGSLTVGVADDLPAWLDLHSGSGAVRIGLAASAEPAAGEPYVTVRARTGSGEISVHRA